MSNLTDVCGGQTVRLDREDITAIKLGLNALMIDAAYQLEYEEVNKP